MLVYPFARQYLFGRSRKRAEFSAVVIAERLFQELCHTVHCGIGVIFQKLFVSGKIVRVVKRFCGKSARSRSGMTVRIFTFYLVTKSARAYYPAAIVVGVFGVRFFYPFLRADTP